MKRQSSYTAAGVDTEKQDQAMPRLRELIEGTFAFRKDRGTVKLPLGYFANVIDVGQGIGLALSTDGVGSKILIAQMLDKYDTIGIDCVAMNVNDVLCVGAEPLALLDYMAVETPHFSLIESLSLGLNQGAKMAAVAIPGGEIAQVKEMIRGPREGYAFDLVATCVGYVPIDSILFGQAIQPGDVVIGLCSSGIHSNGLTLARRIFFDRLKWPVDRHVPELGTTIGEALLEPTRIYVKEVLAMLKAGLAVKALAHITSSGFLNLGRAEAPVGYLLDELPEPQPIFRLIQECGNVGDEEMFFTFNMGIGFCVIVAADDVSSTLKIAREHNVESQVIGITVDDPEKKVTIPQRRLVGSHNKFSRE